MPGCHTEPAIATPSLHQAISAGIETQSQSPRLSADPAPESHEQIQLFPLPECGRNTHSAPTPAVLYFLESQAELQLGTDKVNAEAGSFVYMPPMLSHGVFSRTGLRMLLVQMKD